MRHWPIRLILLVVMALAVGDARAQPQPDAQRWLIGEWVGGDGGRLRPRRIEFKTLRETAPGGLTAEGVFGYLDKRPAGPIKAQIDGSAAAAVVRFETPGKSKVVLRRLGEGELVGTFTLAGGQQSAIHLYRALTAINWPGHTRIDRHLIGGWVGETGNSPVQRYLELRAVRQIVDGRILAAGIYGVADGDYEPVTAFIERRGNDVTLTLETPDKARLAVTRRSDGEYTGWFVSPDGLRTTARFVKAASYMPGQEPDDPLKAGTTISKGDRFPDIQFVNAAGKPKKLSDLRGKPVLLVFWETWSPFCRDQMPILSTLRGSYGDDKLALVLLNISGGGEAARAFMKKNQLDLPVSEARTWPPQGTIRGIPTNFLIDRDGSVIERFRYVPFHDLDAVIKSAIERN
ncbi:MAG: TlpA family protein disulfide reductase [Proteobacteria bacterium]|nr:TlpA family protein disulfide reductase [Pseudomonadota bacterium]